MLRHSIIWMAFQRGGDVTTISVIPLPIAARPSLRSFLATAVYMCCASAFQISVPSVRTYFLLVPMPRFTEKWRFVFRGEPTAAWPMS